MRSQTLYLPPPLNSSAVNHRIAPPLSFVAVQIHLSITAARCPVSPFGRRDNGVLLSREALRVGWSCF
ncbi:hypothetical protein H5410_049476 [Solanum commersonii]|uniref:Uncharacterized protein n=1 Tax=Solanum commersonii TaxID=4109 RepID=A0A9J5WSP6_SOLCO|nr:hypothetical protein H5410_049476 [Solanum commersonii]